MSQGRSTPWSLGMGDLQPLMTGILIMRPYKPLGDWVDEFIPYYIYGNNGSLDPSTHEIGILVTGSVAFFFHTVWPNP